MPEVLFDSVSDGSGRVSTAGFDPTTTRGRAVSTSAVATTLPVPLSAPRLAALGAIVSHIVDAESIAIGRCMIRQSESAAGLDRRPPE